MVTMGGGGGGVPPSVLNYSKDALLRGMLVTKGHRGQHHVMVRSWQTAVSRASEAQGEAQGGTSLKNRPMQTRGNALHHEA